MIERRPTIFLHRCSTARASGVGDAAPSAPDHIMPEAEFNDELPPSAPGFEKPVQKPVPRSPKRDSPAKKKRAMGDDDEPADKDANADDVMTSWDAPATYERGAPVPRS